MTFGRRPRWEDTSCGLGYCATAAETAHSIHAETHYWKRKQSGNISSQLFAWLSAIESKL